MLRAKIGLLDQNSFARSAAYHSARLNLSLPAAETLSQSYAKLFTPDDWTVYSVSVYPSSEVDEPFSLLVDVRVKRNAASTIFKCIIPMIANALVVMLAASLPTNTRLKVVGLSMISAAAMLNPSFLGLPETVRGVPFAQSLVIIHMAISFMLLVISLRDVGVDYLYQYAIEREEKAYHTSTASIWKTHAATYQRWAQLIDPESAQGATKEAAIHEVPAQPVSSTRSQTSPAMIQVELDRDRGRDLDQAKKGDGSGSIDWQRAMVELLVALPALIHRQDPTRPPKIWTPFWGTPQPHILPKYGKLLQYRHELNHRLVVVFPSLFFFAWALNLLIYFAWD